MRYDSRDIHARRSYLEKQVTVIVEALMESYSTHNPSLDTANSDHVMILPYLDRSYWEGLEKQGKNVKEELKWIEKHAQMKEALSELQAPAETPLQSGNTAVETERVVPKDRLKSLIQGLQEKSDFVAIYGKQNMRIEDIPKYTHVVNDILDTCSEGVFHSIMRLVNGGQGVEQMRQIETFLEEYQALPELATYVADAETWARESNDPYAKKILPKLQQAYEQVVALKGVFESAGKLYNTYKDSL